jgi:hypothetical protein
MLVEVRGVTLARGCGVDTHADKIATKIENHTNKHAGNSLFRFFLILIMTISPPIPIRLFRENVIDS